MKKYLLFLNLLFFVFSLNIVEAQTCSIGLNNGFEIPAIPASSYQFLDASLVPNWSTTSPDNIIEVWSTGFLGVPAYEGNQFAELNGTQASTLIKIFTTPSANISTTVSFAHRGREGTDVMRVQVGLVGGPFTTLGTFSAGNNAWVFNSVPYTTGVIGTYELRFEAISSGSGNIGVGNFLDAVDPGVIPIIASIGAPTTFQCANLVLDGSASSAGPSITYTWTTSGGNIVSGQGTNSIVVNAVGTYTLTVTNTIQNCTDTKSITLTDLTSIPNAGADQTICLTSTSLNANTPAVGAGSWSLISGSGTFSNANSPTTSVSGLSIGTNVFRWTIANGSCNKIDEVNINVLLQPNAGADGSLSICSSSASIINLFSIITGEDAGGVWTRSSGTGGIFNAAAGTFTPDITTTNSTFTYSLAGTSPCLSDNSLATILVNTVNFTYSIAPLLCNGANNASITIAASGGTPSYQYSIDNVATFQASNIFLDLSAGSYQVVVKDINSCSTTQTVVVDQPAILTVTTATTPVPCNAANTGSITVTVVGGVAPYQYSINNGAIFQASNIFVNLAAGSYSTVVKDFNSCSTTQTVVVASLNTLTYNTFTTPALCNGASNGSITITGVGGIAPYQYSIDNGATFHASNMFLGQLAGSYQVVVKDANNCSTTQTVVVAQPAILTFTTATTAALCNGANNGSITVTAVGGTAPYQFSNDNGATFQASNIFLGQL
ncbi:MAG: PKD domain-containing protein, partial [Ferruginibacter sp.]